MWRTGVMAALAVGMVAWPAAVGDPAPGGHGERLRLTGQVVVHSDETRHATVVTVDLETDSAVADGLVDHAFRVQDPSLLILYRGRATLEYVTGLLVIRPLDNRRDGFGYTVSALDASAEGDVSIHAAAGLSRFWGEHITQPVDEVQARLLAPRCVTLTGTESLVGCTSCDEGGPGTSQCELLTAPTGCEAACSEGSYACCNYPDDCGCCPEIEQR